MIKKNGIIIYFPNKPSSFFFVSSSFLIFSTKSLMLKNEPNLEIRNGNGNEYFCGSIKNDIIIIKLYIFSFLNEIYLRKNILIFHFWDTQL
jgi:hypothetical protein